MKKSFFKKLSFVLALAMIVSTIAPAAGAFAATSPKINSAKKYLLLGQTSEYDFHVDNKIAGSTYKWSTSNKAVATVTQKGLTVAKSVGTAKITVKATTKTGKVYSSSATVIVKDNFKSLTITGAPADGKAAVGAEVALGTTGTTYGGATSSASAIVRFAVTDKDGKAVTGATVSDAGVFKATVAGTYTVTANAFQSTAKYDAWKTTGTGATATASTTITVANTATLKQVDQSSFKLTFSSPVESLAVADVAVSYLVGTTEVGTVVKSVTLDTDKLSATVVLYNAFVAGSTYNVVVKGFDKAAFVAATTNLADVASMTITPVAVTINSATKLVVKMFNKDGVDITTSDLLKKVTFTNSSEKTSLSGTTADTAAADVNRYKIAIYNVGDTTTLTATLHSYTYDTTTGAEKDTKTATAAITGTAAATYTATGIAAWSLGAAAVTDFSNANHVLAVEDGAKVLSIKTALNDSDKTVKYSKTIANPEGFKFESSDSSVLIVNDATKTVYPVKAGTASVIVSYTANANANPVVWSVVGAVPITVGAKRAATTINLGTYSFGLTNSPAVADTKSVSVEVLDQYGVAFPFTIGVPEQQNSTLTQSLVQTVGATSVTFAASNKPAGQYTYKITAAGLSKYVVINVTEPAAGGATYYRLSLDNTSYDQKLSSTTHAVTANFKLLGYATNGVATSKVAVTGTAVGTYHFKLIDPNGTEQQNSMLTIAADADGTANAVAQFKVYQGYAGGATTGSAVVARATGTWTLKAYDSTGLLVDATTFVVKDTTVAPIVTVKTLYPTEGTLTAALPSIFTVNINGNDVTPLFVEASDIIGAGNTISIQNVRYYDATTQYTYVIPVKVTVHLAFNY